jgi:poly-gamma-glutamate synthesis protein (capsule biosynthesis protein)
MAKILIAGDYAPKYRIAECILRKNYSFLDEVKSVLKTADYSILNFESPVVSGHYKPIVKRGPNLSTNKFAVDAIKYAGFNLVTLANNHILDYGVAGINETVQSCREHGIETVGVGANLKEASAIKYIQISNYKVAIINCCEHEFSIATDTCAGANPLDPVRQFYAIKEAKKRADYIIVIVHGGHEMFQLPSPRMVETYRFFIDVGADAVVNHHQHCFSGYEIYKGKPIFYGLGNFCFDKQSANQSLWNFGYMVKLSLQDGKFDIIPYEQCGENASIVLLENEKLTNFKLELERLNEVISDSDKLAEEYRNWINHTNFSMKLALSPFSNRLIQSAQSRKLMPLCISRSRVKELFNYVNCESHRDKFIATLEQELPH